MCSHNVCFKFSMCSPRCSQWIPIMFTMCSPNMFSMDSHPVLNSISWDPIMFSMCSPNMLSMGSHHVLNVFSIAPHFLSPMLWQMLSSFHPYSWAKGGNPILETSNSIWHLLVKAKKSPNSWWLGVLVGEENWGSFSYGWWSLEKQPLVCWWTACLHVCGYASQVRVNLSPNLNHTWWSLNHSWWTLVFTFHGF
jgi:hypothetical protein